MSVHYLIDGYNLMNQIPSISSEKLEDARQSLVRFIKKNNLTGSFRNEVTIVFDGKEEVFSLSVEKEFKIIFSKGEIADDKIKRMIASSENPARIILVTNDKDLVFFAKNHGAYVHSVKVFLSKVSKSENKSIAGGLTDKSRLPFRKAHEITQELKKIWLNGEKDKI
ncbi:MAG: NYN domain-containing protein [Candidatus Omnitrophota bacterium]